MKINVKPILATYGQSIPIEYTFSLADIELMGEKPFQSPIVVSGQVSNRLGMLELSITATTTFHSRCARCLKEVVSPLETEIFFILSQDEVDEESEALWQIEGDLVELDDIVYPAVILDAPSTVLCDEACKGLCQSCGGNLNEGPCGCNKVEIDPRMAALQQLLKKE